MEGWVKGEPSAKLHGYADRKRVQLAVELSGT